MTFEQPIWFLLLLPFVVALQLWPPFSRWLRIGRWLTCLMVVLALTHPFLRLPDHAGTLVIVADRSRSLPADAAEAQREVIQTLQKAMRPRDQLAVVSFGEEAVVERAPQRGPFAGFSAQIGNDLSRLHEGLEAALDLVPPDRPGRLLILSDGRWTGRDPLPLAARAAERGIAFDYRPQARPPVNEIAIQRFEAPASLAPEQACFLSAWVDAPRDQEVTYQLSRGTNVLASGKRMLSSGTNRLMFRDRAPSQGSLQYLLQVTGTEPDPCPENNQARALVSVRAPRAVLSVSESGPASGLADLLRRGGLPVIARTPSECAWSLEDLSQYSAVILENVMANPIGHAGLETLAAWVEQTGAGLMLTGGRKSYGPGGYYRSPLERILPVSLEMRQEHRKARVAIVVALDRSGSMSVSAGGGRTKMALADLGAAQVLDLLMPTDEFGVIAVDSSPHTIVGLDNVANNAAKRSQILSIDSAGGGIFIYEALSAAARMLLAAQANSKHIILFADAADSEEEGNYPTLIAGCREAGITVSVVGLGTVADVDAALLQHIAQLGEGNCFFTASPEEIPRLFAQDTFTVVRSTFVDEPSPFRFTAGMASLGGQPNGAPPALGGYNLCYLRSEATLAAVTTDNYAAPVVASWQAGSGRVLCYTGEADGKSSGAMAAWDSAGEFYTSLARWTAGDEEPPSDHWMITHEVRDGACAIQLHLEPERTSDPFAEAPTARVLHGLPGQSPTTTSHRFAWVSADVLEVELPIRGRETLLPTVCIAGRRPIQLAPLCLPYSPEYKPDPTGRGIATLRRLAEVSGGQERVDLASTWKALPTKTRQVLLTPWLVVLALTFFLLEILERRTGWLSRRWPTKTSAVSPHTTNAPARGSEVRRSPVEAAMSPASSPPTAPSPLASRPASAVDASEGAAAVDALADLRQARRRAQERRRE